MPKFYSQFISVFLLSLIFSAQNINAQSPILKSFIHTTDEQHNTPFIPMNKVIDFSFDIIGDNNDFFRYKITPCSIDWTPTTLNLNLFIEGGNTYTIYEQENAIGTLTNYTHFKFSLPNSQTKITRTGNYIISILGEGDTEIASKKIILYNPKINCKGIVTPSNETFKQSTHQRIQFSIDTQNITINFPNKEITPIIYKNNDFNIHSPSLTPTYLQNKLLLYENIDAPEFYGGNEFLNFDTNNLLRTTDKIATLYKKDIYHHTLYTNQSRKENLYTFNPDINGNFIIRNHNDYNIDTESDYSLIEFSLQLPNNFSNTKPIYVYGAFNNYQLTTKNLFKYNPNSNLYETQILLKQGFYNYNFVTLEQNTINEIELNGSHIETENEYQLVVYYNPNNSLHYEVVGFTNINSKEFIK